MSKKATELAEAPKSGLSSVLESDTLEQSDIDIPRINIVQKTSDITGPDGEPVATGSIVLDKQFVLAGPDDTIKVIPVMAMKAWREDIPYDSDEISRIANSKEERDALSKESDYSMLEFADITLLIKGGDITGPDGNPVSPDKLANGEAFPFPMGEENGEPVLYALGRINVAKDAYRQTFKRLTTFGMFNRGVEAYARLWKFNSSLITRGRYSWYAPSLNVTQEAPDEAVSNFIGGFIGQ